MANRLRPYRITQPEKALQIPADPAATARVNTSRPGEWRLRAKYPGTISPADRPVSSVYNILMIIPANIASLYNLFSPLSYKVHQLPALIGDVPNGKKYLILV